MTTCFWVLLECFDILEDGPIEITVVDDVTNIADLRKVVVRDFSLDVAATQLVVKYKDILLPSDMLLSKIAPDWGKHLRTPFQVSVKKRTGKLLFKTFLFKYNLYFIQYYYMRGWVGLEQGC